MDADGYPDEEELARVRAWPHTDLPGWFAFVKSIWWQPAWGWQDATEAIPLYCISTCGWSGNEEIIDAMQENAMCWALTWESSRRGGHYQFRLLA